MVTVKTIKGDNGDNQRESNGTFSNKDKIQIVQTPIVLKEILLAYLNIRQIIKFMNYLKAQTSDCLQ